MISAGKHLAVVPAVVLMRKSEHERHESCFHQHGPRALTLGTLGMDHCSLKDTEDRMMETDERGKLGGQIPEGLLREQKPRQHGYCPTDGQRSTSRLRLLGVCGSLCEPRRGPDGLFLEDRPAALHPHISIIVRVLFIYLSEFRCSELRWFLHHGGRSTGSLSPPIAVPLLPCAATPAADRRDGVEERGRPDTSSSSHRFYLDSVA
ncbi:unnamed protein product [Pleuronectes platessa]|uniref:Uncharacterized protein n=1 Tax=Pleuronectes platessa TaxID=8262 RepID=A0A9N7UW80_PLEPL|nr:unnamed protein product [Pleuronectes platessa]